MLKAAKAHKTAFAAFFFAKQKIGLGKTFPSGNALTLTWAANGILPRAEIKMSNQFPFGNTLTLSWAANGILPRAEIKFCG